MDLLLILRDALASSLIGSVLAAVDAKRSGREVGVLVTQEALAALARGTFGWPRELAGPELRLAMADRAEALGLALTTKGDGRQIDARAVVALARKTGVPLYACPIWSALLGLEGALPDGLQALERAALPALLVSAKRVVGSL